MVVWPKQTGFLKKYSRFLGQWLWESVGVWNFGYQCYLQFNFHSLNTIESFNTNISLSFKRNKTFKTIQNSDFKLYLVNFHFLSAFLSINNSYLFPKIEVKNTNSVFKFWKCLTKLKKFYSETVFFYIFKDIVLVQKKEKGGGYLIIFLSWQFKIKF